MPKFYHGDVISMILKTYISHSTCAKILWTQATHASFFYPRHAFQTLTHATDHPMLHTPSMLFSRLGIKITQRKLQLFILKFYAKRKTFDFTKCWFMHRYFLKSLRIFEPYYFSEIFSHASATFRYWATSIKGILMQIWKSPYMLVSIKSNTLKIAFLILGILKLYARKVCEIFVYKHTETIKYVKN